MLMLQNLQGLEPSPVSSKGRQSSRLNSFVYPTSARYALSRLRTGRVRRDWVTVHDSDQVGTTIMFSKAGLPRL